MCRAVPGETSNDNDAAGPNGLPGRYVPGPPVMRQPGHRIRDTAGIGAARVRALPAAPVRGLLRLPGERHLPRPPALTRLKSRFYGPARRSIIRQTKGWPRHVEVSAPRIRIIGRVAVSANLATATLHTVETWLVRTAAGAKGKPGKVLFTEKNKHLVITLHRTPTMLCVAGHCLHKWV